jgi:hypothetical protein
MARLMITTLDNPFNPHTDFERWYAYDQSKGYQTCSYLARIAKVSDDLSAEDEEIAINNAVNEIMDFNLSGNYKIVRDDELDR